MIKPILAACAVLALTATGPARADTALILANDRYAEAQSLREADAILGLRRPLDEAGFDVIVVRNGTGAEMRAGLSDLLAADPGRIVIAAAGHFLRGGRDTWLVGTEADTPDLATIGGAGLPVSVMAEIAAAAPGRAVLLLGLERRRIEAGTGLEAGIGPLDLPQGVTAIAGAPDDLAAFAREVLLVPGEGLAAGLSRYRGLRGFGFVSDAVPFLAEATAAPRPVSPPVAERGPLPPPAVAPAEVALWAAALELDTPAAYRAYLDRFPAGAYAAQARDRIAALEDDPIARAEAAEAALGLTAAGRREIQRDLTLLGFDTRGVDGIFGPGTRSAIAGWQTREGAPATGFLTAPEIATLARQADARAAEIAAEEAARREAEERADRAWWQATGQGRTEAGLVSYLDRYPEGLYADVAAARLAEITGARDREAWRRAEALDSVAGYRDYLRDWPDGLFAAEAQGRIAALTSGLTPREQAEAEAREAALNLAPVTRSLIEQRLAGLGLDPGRVDGVFDTDTRRALADYQRARGLAVTGYVDRVTVVRLMAEMLGGRIVP